MNDAYSNEVRMWGLSERKPMTREVRNAYQFVHDGSDWFKRGSDFDSWLENLKATVWDEGFVAATKLRSNWISWNDIENPYSTEHWNDVLSKREIEE